MKRASIIFTILAGLFGATGSAFAGEGMIIKGEIVPVFARTLEMTAVRCVNYTEGEMMADIAIDGETGRFEGTADAYTAPIHFGCFVVDTANEGEIIGSVEFVDERGDAWGAIVLQQDFKSIDFGAQTLDDDGIITVYLDTVIFEP